MKENAERHKSLHRQPPERVLGVVQPGDFDTELARTPPGASESGGSAEPVQGLAGLHKDQAKNAPAGSTKVPTDAERAVGSAAAQIEDKLALPEGALVAMRKSGGFRFTSRQVTIYLDGRVAVSRSDPAPRASAPVETPKLRDKELAHLYRTLARANLPGLPATSGRQNPDGYAYEIAARVGHETYSVEAFDGSIPGELAPLIQELTDYLGRGDPGQASASM